MNLVAIGAAAVPAFVVLSLFGPWIIGLWTKGAIVAPPGLVLALSGVMLLNALWHPISNLMLALNRQSEYAYFYLVVSLCSVAISYPLTIECGPLGAAYSLLVAEGLMTVYIYNLVRRMHLFDYGLLRARCRTLISNLRVNE
jgi:O-antigen/teichoic acid export membrane protein